MFSNAKPYAVVAIIFAAAGFVAGAEIEDRFDLTGDSTGPPVVCPEPVNDIPVIEEVTVIGSALGLK